MKDFRDIRIFRGPLDVGTESDSSPKKGWKVVEGQTGARPRPPLWAAESGKEVSGG